MKFLRMASLLKNKFKRGKSLTILRLGNDQERVVSYTSKFPAVPPPASEPSPLMLQVRWTADEIRAENLHKIATELLLAGFESPSLACLAGTTNVRARTEVDELVHATLCELGCIHSMTLEQARGLLVQQLARQVIAGQIGPESAGSSICALYEWNHEVENLRVLDGYLSESCWNPEAEKYETPITEDFIAVFARIATQATGFEGTVR